MNSNTYKNLFIKIFCITLLVKIFLAYFTPMTGDEAFFYQWGVFPAAGYSDHPPMVGWLIFLLRMLGEHPLILRAFTVLLTSIIGLGIVLLCQKTLDQKYQAHAWLIGALYLCLPWSWLFFMVTTDTTLVLFMFCSGLVYMLADRQASASKALVLYALCGILLGLAFLSKYFSALLGFAFAIHCLLFRRKRLWAPFVILAFALPAICFNLWFNATHGWSNIMFNVFNRNQDKQWSIGTLIGYIAMVVYIITPWTIFYAFKSKKTFATDKKLVYSALALWSVPFALFLVLSIKRSIGLHWVIGFVPFFMIWAAYRLHTEHLQKSIKWTIYLSIPHFLIFLTILFAPMSFWGKFNLQHKAVFLHKTDQITQNLESSLPADGVIMAYAYSPAATLAFYHKAYVPVFGEGKFHSRQDDQIIDFKDFAGKTIRIYTGRQQNHDFYKAYFDEIQPQTMQVDGVDFYFVDGTNFNFEKYRDTVLKSVAQKYHNAPSWLPNLGDPYCERYGFDFCSPQK